MQFMCQKSFHPSSKANQRKLWIAQQKAKDDAKRERDRTDELNKERVMQQHRKMSGSSKSLLEQMDFMYQTPGGVMKRNIDDDAPISMPGVPQQTEESHNMVGPAVPALHPKDTVSHPVLVNAPKEGDYVDKLDLKNFRPLGVKVRHVRCARCGQKGHASGDRECPLANMNPNDAARKRAEDPASALLNVAVVNPYSNHLILKDHILKDQLGDDEGLLQDDPIDEDDPEKAFLNSLTKKQKKKLLRQLEKKEKKKKKKHHHKKSKKNSKKRKRTSSTDEDTSSSSDEQNPKKKQT